MPLTSPFAKPPPLVIGVEPPNLYRITLTAMITEWWLVLGAWMAAGVAVALIGFVQIAIITTAVGMVADLIFQRRLRHLWAVSRDTEPVAGLRRLMPLVATRFALGVIGPVAAALLEPSAETLAVVLLMQAWSVCVAIAQFTASPRLFYTAVAAPVLAVGLALLPHLDGSGGAALLVTLALTVAMLVAIGNQVGEVWRRWRDVTVMNAAMMQDVEAARAQAEEQRDLARQAEAAALAASKAKSVFLATMSHEIRTPLNGVLGMAQVMELNTLSRDQRERVRVLRASGQALLSTLNDVLDLSRIEAGRLEIKPTPVSPADVARLTIAAFTASAEIKGLTLMLDIDRGAERTVIVDGQRVRQILFNLVGNAVKFTDAGGVTLKVSASEASLVFRITDTGGGIASDDLARIFEPFEQIDNALTRDKQGSGLGLAICRELATLIGGDVTAISTIGSGSSFILTVPVTVANEASAPVDQQDGHGAVSPLDGMGEVLVAEDNMTNQIVIRTILEHLGISPSVVANGQEAVEAWSQQVWSLILMDVQMPVMDGLAATREIRAREIAQGLEPMPIIALTGNALEHQIEECLDAGMSMVVAKPIEITTLIAAINQVMDHGHAEVSLRTARRTK